MKIETGVFFSSKPFYTVNSDMVLYLFCPPLQSLYYPSSRTLLASPRLALPFLPADLSRPLRLSLPFFTDVNFSFNIAPLVLKCCIACVPSPNPFLIFTGWSFESRVLPFLFHLPQPLNHSLFFFQHRTIAATKELHRNRTPFTTPLSRSLLDYPTVSAQPESDVKERAAISYRPAELVQFISELARATSNFAFRLRLSGSKFLARFQLPRTVQEQEASTRSLDAS